MLRTLCVIAVVGSVLMISAGSVQAQTRTGTTTGGGLFGSGSTGSGASASNRSTTTGGSSSTGSTGSTGGTSGGVTQGPTPGSQSNVATDAMANRQRFETTQVAGEFAGADAADTTNFLSRQTGTTRATNNLNGLQNLFSQGLQQLNQQSQRSTRPQIRVPLKMGFAPPPASLTRVQKFTGHLGKLPGIQFQGLPQIEMEDRTAVLRGVVASEEDRRLAEALAKMEPEVLAVRNELTVAAPAASTAEALPPANP